MKLFREEAIEARRRRLWGEVRLAQPPALTIWTALLAVICIAAFMALVFGRYTRKETVQGFLAPEAGVVQIHSIQGGRIAQVLVREGEAVSEGTPLIELVSDVGSIGRGPVLDMQLDETDRQTASLSDREAAVRRGFLDEAGRLADQIEAQQRLRTILLGQRSVQADALSLAQAEMDRLQALQARGFAPRAEVDRRRRTVLAERGALADLDSRISQAEASGAELRSQVAGIAAREAEATARITSERAALAQRRADLEVARGYVLRAPVAGTVSGLQARPGMTPTGERLLLSIAPAGSELQAHLLVPTRAAGFLKAGQEARLQVEAFPFQRFGFVEGRILDLATTVLRPGEVPFPIEHSEPVYIVRVALAHDYVNAYGERRHLRPGMALRADIPIDRRRLWQQLFDPIVAAGRRSGS